MWPHADIADTVEQGLRQRAAADDLEQAVYGFDGRPELELHPILHEAVHAAGPGWGVLAEQRYPDAWGRSRKSEGERCDIVLTPRDGQVLRDPGVKATLFAAADHAAVDPEEAYWLEVKTVSQHEAGVGFRGYSSELLNPVTKDINKLWRDGVIRHAGLLIVLFTETRDVAEHDIEAWHRHCVSRGQPVGPPLLRGFAITDRIGNAWCAVALCAVRG